MIWILLFALAQPHVLNVGLSSFSFTDATRGDTIHAAIWYPTAASTSQVTLRLQTFDVAQNASIAAPRTRYPVVLISHGTGGDEFGHWDIAEALVRAGFIVVSIRHAGDNSRDHSALGTDRYLYGRSFQMHALLDTLLADPAWSRHIDPKRVGFVGYSAGGFTGLELLGAAPNLARLTAYCVRHPTDNLYCAGGLHGSFTLTGKFPGPSSDSRVKSAALLAPAFAFLFDSAQLARITEPVLLARAERDSLVLEPDNVRHIVLSLPIRPRVVLMRGGSHYIFLAPCGVRLAKVAPEICTDAPGVSRKGLHEKLNRDLVAFFLRTL